ncbi:glycoside hydrolase family 2 TIM barrel-domain containing protein [Aliiglaciecola sp. NS0011-25]|uniref:glycoside hydrolase family 2 TIM barrel-domain containing protein n=1 Tax=Aliiglaciecola sp. NS0011-25 TaxID=3127654 RepID=UPI003106FF80
MMKNYLCLGMISALFLVCQPLMAKQKLSRKPEWNRVDIQQVNAELPHANITPYKELATANNQQSLNGQWKFHFAENPEQRPESFYQNDFDTSHWQDISVPANWELNGYGRPYYVNSGYVFKMQQPFVPSEQNHVGSYRRNFSVPKHWLSKEVFVNFGAVSNAFYLWVNGEKVGYSQGSKTPAEFNITPYIKAGENNISLEVYRFSDGSYLEDVDAWRLSGVTRDVRLYASSKVRVRDYFIKAGLEDNYQHGRLKMELDIANHLQQTFDGQLLVTLAYNSKTIGQFKQQLALSAKQENSKLMIDEKISQVLAWSAETPHLYQVTISLLDSDNKLLDKIDDHLGFRSVELKNGQLLVNGKVITLRGVNRHEHDMKTGHVVSKASMEKDIALLKKFNVNAVRTSHYPNDPYWYKLADQYGLYLIDEANIESHGYMNKRTALGSLPQWHKAHMTRMKAMVERDKNHPSIIVWSLGNEASGGKAFQDMYDWTKQRDDSRLVQYQAAGLVDYTDIYVPFYRSPTEVKQYLDGEPLKPLIHSEYAHAMGNSLGGFQKHWDVIYQYPMAQGGFIWDWHDQGLLQYREDGSSYFAYGGDFGPQQVDGVSPPKKPLRGNFLANGIMQADKTPNPHAWEMKKVFQPLLISAVDLNTLTFKVVNRRDFANSKDLDFSWHLSENGVEILTERFSVEPVEAGASSQVQLSLPTFKQQAGAEYFLTIKAHANKFAGPLIPKQHLVAWQQFKLPITKSATALDLAAFQPLKVSETNETINVAGGKFQVKLNKATGLLSSLTYDNVEMLRTGLEANFWRPLTDNDIGGKLHISSKQWKNAPEKFDKNPQVSVEHISDKAVTINVARKNGKRFSYQSQYRVFASGDIHVNSSLRPIQENGKDLLRFGMTMTLPVAFDNLQWYGRGPHESYSDRYLSAPIGQYSANVWSQYHPYARPQETGNKMDLRWLALSNKAGYGLLVKGAPTFSGSALQLANKDLYFQPKKNKHGRDIKPGEFITLNIDKRQIGVGGDNSWNEKGLAKAEHRLPWQFYRQQFYLRPFGPSENLSQLTKQALPE